MMKIAKRPAQEPSDFEKSCPDSISVGALTFLSIATAYLLCIVKGESHD